MSTTKSGLPCNGVPIHLIACASHATDEHLQMAAEIRGALNAAEERGARYARLDIENERRAAAREAERASRWRERDALGQLVVVSTGYTYRWTGDDPLDVGDEVVIPGNWLVTQAQRVAVKSIGSDYVGDITDVLRRAS